MEASGARSCSPRSGQLSPDKARDPEQGGQCEKVLALSPRSASFPDTALLFSLSFVTSPVRLPARTIFVCSLAFSQGFSSCKRLFPSALLSLTLFLLSCQPSPCPSGFPDGFSCQPGCIISPISAFIFSVIIWK